MIVNVEGIPWQPFAVGVMVMVATSGAVPVFVAVNEGMGPVPLAARPMDGVLLLQAKVLPATGLLKVTTEVTAPLQ